MIWDGASYHRSGELKAYLETVNQGLDPDQLKITCIRLAPNAPQQNPVEDILLAAKRWIRGGFLGANPSPQNNRKCYHLCCSFEAVQLLFELVTHRQVFNFPKLHEYGVFS